MRRKLIQMAGKTLLVSIPHDWARNKGLQKGEEVEVSERGSALEVRKVKPARSSSISVDVSGLNASLVWHGLVSCFIKGYGEIEVRFKEGKILDPRSKSNITPSEAVERALDAMIGMEVVKQSSTSMTIKEVSSMVTEEYPALLRRVWLTVIAMAEEGYKSLEEHDEKNFKKVILQEREVNRLSLLALRMLHRGVATEISNALIEYQMLQSLEVMGDAIVALSKVKPSRKIAGQLKETALLVRSAYTCWFEPTNLRYEELYSHLLKVRSFRSTDVSFLVSASELVTEAVASRWMENATE